MKVIIYILTDFHNLLYSLIASQYIFDAVKLTFNFKRMILQWKEKPTFRVLTDYLWILYRLN